MINIKANAVIKYTLADARACDTLRIAKSVPYTPHVEVTDVYFTPKQDFKDQRATVTLINLRTGQEHRWSPDVPCEFVDLVCELRRSPKYGG